jgi:hypothetical protein
MTVHQISCVGNSGPAGNNVTTTPPQITVEHGDRIEWTSPDGTPVRVEFVRRNGKPILPEQANGLGGAVHQGSMSVVNPPPKPNSGAYDYHVFVGAFSDTTCPTVIIR